MVEDNWIAILPNSPTPYTGNGECLDQYDKRYLVNNRVLGLATFPPIARIVGPSVDMYVD
jgi:hypothetical protein